VSLPLKECRTAVSKPKELPSIPASNQSISVLLVDDEETWVRTQRRLLERASDRLRISTATSFESAINAISETPPECIVCDYQLGDGTGLDLLRRVRTDNVELPFILVTGEGDETVASEAIGEQVTDYIRKLHLSQQPSKLAERIISAVAADRTRRALTRERQSKERLLETVTSSATRSELGENICEQLVTAGYACAWIATLDADRGVIPLSTAGDTDYLEATITPGTRPTDSTEPTLVALADIKPVVKTLPDTDEPGDDAWKKHAISYGFRSVAAVPISHETLQFGVLSVYSDAVQINDRELQLLSAYADTIAYAFQTDTWKQTLLSSASASVEFTLTGGCHPLVTFASHLPARTTLRVTSVIPRNDREVLYVTTIDGATDDDLSEAADATDSIVSIDLYRTDEDNRILCGVITESPVPETRLVDTGVSLSQTVVNSEYARLSVVLSGETTVNACVDVLSECCGKDAVTTLWTASKTHRSTKSNTPTELTDRQQQVLELAVEAGYFERPRHNNTGELADALDISRATFTQHLRAAQRKLFLSNIHKQ